MAPVPRPSCFYSREGLTLKPANTIRLAKVQSVLYPNSRTMARKRQYSRIFAACGRPGLHPPGYTTGASAGSFANALARPSARDLTSHAPALYYHFRMILLRIDSHWKVMRLGDVLQS